MVTFSAQFFESPVLFVPTIKTFVTPQQFLYCIIKISNTMMYFYKAECRIVSNLRKDVWFTLSVFQNVY